MSELFLFSLFIITVGLPYVCYSFSIPFLTKHAVNNTVVIKNVSAIVLIADGTEDLEAVTTIDLLRRANVQVTVAGVAGVNPVKCQYGCTLTPDTSLDTALTQGLYDAVVIPGGEGACLLMAQSDKVGKLLTDHVKEERLVAASTTGPIVLDAHRINYLQRLTSAPVFSEKLNKHYSYHNFEETIVDIPGKMITSRFLGTIMEFGLSVINHLVDRKTAEKVSKELHPFVDP